MFKIIRITNSSLKNVVNPFRTFASSNNEVGQVFINRNPRNLEKLCIAYKPDGYHLEKPGRCYWHKLQLSVSSKYVRATITHFNNGPVIQAGTNEWALKKHLYRFNDASAYYNLGRVLAHRCLMFGINEIECYLKPTTKIGKLGLFLKALEENSITLRESPQYKNPRPWDQHRPSKPWEVTE